MGIIDKLIGKVRAIVAAEATDAVTDAVADHVSNAVAKRDAHGRFVKGASKANVPSIKAKR